MKLKPILCGLLLACLAAPMHAQNVPAPTERQLVALDKIAAPLRKKVIDILQDGRGYYHRASGMVHATSDFTLVVANLNVQFLGEGFFGEAIMCHSGLLSLGRTSQTVAQLAMQADRPIAYAETVMVTMLDGKAAPHPETYREQMEPWLIRR